MIQGLRSLVATVVVVTAVAALATGRLNVLRLILPAAAATAADVRRKTTTTATTQRNAKLPRDVTGLI